MRSILNMKPGLVGGLLVSVLSGTTSAGGVWITHGPASGYPWRTIQAAVDGAVDGDVLIVASGTYAGFTVDDKSLSIVAAEGAAVQVLGTIEVRNLQSQRFVLLSGISSAAVAEPFADVPALRLVNNAGHVRIEASTHAGSDGGESQDGGEGALLIASTRVAMTRCVLLGGDGGLSDFAPGLGGDGVTAIDSVVSLYDCSCTGGAGGFAFDLPGEPGGGRGGDGCRTTLGLFASGTSFTGGPGGDGTNHPFPGGYGGDGGNGLTVDVRAGAHLLDNTYQGGEFGEGWVPRDNGEMGQGVTGPGAIAQHPGTARRLSAPALTSDEVPWTATLTGLAGDEFRLQFSHAPAYRYASGLTGMRLGSPPFLQNYPSGIAIPASGTIAVQLPSPSMQPPIAGRLVLLQALVEDSQGTQVLGSPLHKIFLDRRGQPDCNGNGILDYYDVVEGTSADVNGDLVPDACDPDCNGNSSPDWQEIQNDPGLDLDENGVLDECEPANTYYVDANAASGGDGSLANPFRTIVEGVQATGPGDTVVVRDGTYVGAANRDVDLVYPIAVRSQNGPGNCTIDLQGAGRAFVTAQGPPLAARIQGFTIRNGFSDGLYWYDQGGAIFFQRPGVVISDCVFIDNYARSGGGAIYCMEAIVEQSEFIDNRTEPRTTPNFGGYGGALNYYSPGSSDPVGLLVRNCLFSGNSAYAAGALQGFGPMTISHSVFERNYAVTSGGAASLYGKLYMDGCRIAGNACEGLGGGLSVGNGNSTPMSVTGTTFTSNYAATKGGAVAAWATNLQLSNCILWGDDSPLGPELMIYPAPYYSPTVAVSFCDLEGGQAAVRVEGSATLYWGIGNLAVDPLFFDADGPDNLPLTFPDNDYRLGAGSPCADAANNAAVPRDRADIDGDGNTSELVPWDLLSRPRFRDDPTIPDTGNGTAPIVDMGAYERQSATQP